MALRAREEATNPGLQLLCGLPLSHPEQLLHGLHWLWVDAIGRQSQALWAAAVLQTLPSSDFYLVLQKFLLTTNGPKCPHLQAHHFRKTYGGKGRDEETDECTPFQNPSPPCLHCISASPGEFRNISARFPRCLSMSAQTSCLMTVQNLSPLPYISSLEAVILGLSAFVTSWLHWERRRRSLTEYWQQLKGGMGWGVGVVY